MYKLAAVAVVLAPLVAIATAYVLYPQPSDAKVVNVDAEAEVVGTCLPSGETKVKITPTIEEATGFELWNGESGIFGDAGETVCLKDDEYTFMLNTGGWHDGDENITGELIVE